MPNDHVNSDEIGIGTLQGKLRTPIHMLTEKDEKVSKRKEEADIKVCTTEG